MKFKLNINEINQDPERAEVTEKEVIAAAKEISDILIKHVVYNEPTKTKTKPPGQSPQPRRQSLKLAR